MAGGPHQLGPLPGEDTMASTTTRRAGARRVAVWGIGGVGTIALRAVARRPDLELVAVRSHDPAKVGRDAGDLCGLPPIGVLASDDPAVLAGARPDCVCYTANGAGRDSEVVDDIVWLLEQGIDVVTVSLPGLVHPAAFAPDIRDRLERAAVAGGATVYASGIEPGFAADHLPLTLLTMSDTVTSVRTQEIFRYDTYPDPFTMHEVFGFGHLAEHTCLMELPGVQQMTWGPPVRLVADALGWTVERIDEVYEKRVTDRDLDVASGPIAAGTVGAVRFETIAVVDGRPAVVIEHVNRMADDLAPDWPTAERDGTYRIRIDGSPAMTCDLALGDETTEASVDGMVATTMRIVNAIGPVGDAAPGLVGALDLPLTLPTHA